MEGGAYRLTFSPVMAKGVLNHCSKVLQDLKMVGSRKFMSAQSSGRLFWRERTLKHHTMLLYYMSLCYHQVT